MFLVIEGDGVGKEVVPQGVKVLQAVARRYRREFELRRADIGYEFWRETGNALPAETIEACKSSQGILLGAIGSGDLKNIPENAPPGWGRRQLVMELGYSTNVRPARVFSQLANATPLKPERILGTDVIVVRDIRLTNRLGLVPRTARQTDKGWYASDELYFYEDEVVPTLGFAFRLAQSRRKKLTLATQPAVFQSSKLWSRLVHKVKEQFPEIETEVMAPDTCAMQLIRNATQLDVIVSDSSTIGGMLNNLAGLMMGSIGMGPGASLALQDAATPAQMIKPNALYEPIHGTAPRRAGQGIANPIGTILAAAMMLRYSACLESEAQAVERAVETTLAQGYRTYDIMETGKTQVGTQEMGDRIAAAIEADS